MNCLNIKIFLPPCWPVGISYTKKIRITISKHTLWWLSSNE